MLNATWLVNSAAHMWGNRPYDKNINPRENQLVAFSAIGKETELLLGWLEYVVNKHINSINGLLTPTLFMFM